MKYINTRQKSRIVKVKNSPLELGKNFKLFNMSKDDIDKFEEQE